MPTEVHCGGPAAHESATGGPVPNQPFEADEATLPLARAKKTRQNYAPKKGRSTDAAATDCDPIDRDPVLLSGTVAETTRHNDTSRQSPEPRSNRDATDSSRVRRWSQPHRRPNVPRTIRLARDWELPSSLPARQRARPPEP